MYLQHFGLKCDPLGKAVKQTVAHQQYDRLKNKCDGLLHTKGIGLITGEAGTGKTTALRQWSHTLNPLTHKVFYQSDNHFQAFDIYCQLAESLGLEQHHRYSKLWRVLKKELLALHDNKQMTPIWILDEAHQLPANFLLELPSFLNFSFDTREVLIILLVGTPKINALINRSVYSALTSRMLFQFHWEAIDDFETFSRFILTAFQNAGKQETMFSKSGLQLIHLGSKGRLRYAHKIITQCLQSATEQNMNHVPDDIIQHAIEELAS